MDYELAQVNIAKFRLPQNHPVNSDFVNNLDHVNAIAESQPGFIWRFKGEGNDALDVQVFDDSNIAINMSVWSDVESLFAFTYKNSDHVAMMRRRKEWFEKIEFYMVLWWIEAGRKPSLDEAKLRLALLQSCGPTYSAFSFKKPFPKPSN